MFEALKATLPPAEKQVRRSEQLVLVPIALLFRC